MGRVSHGHGPRAGSTRESEGDLQLRVVCGKPGQGDVGGQLWIGRWPSRPGLLPFATSNPNHSNQSFSLRLREDLFQRRLQRDQAGVERGRVEKAHEADDPLSVDDEVRGDHDVASGQIGQHVAGSVRRRNGSIAVEEDGKGEFRSRRESRRVPGGLLDIDDEDLHAAVAVVLPELFEMRSLRITERSPASPEVQDHDLAGQAGEAHARVSGDRRKVEPGSRLSGERLGARGEREKGDR